MNTLLRLLILTILFGFFTSQLIAQDTSANKKTIKSPQNKTEIKHGPGFVDEDGDGYNDNAPDHDGDGIPNGIDPDYTGSKKRKGFVDLDGDGINDNAGIGQNRMRRNRFQKSGSMQKSNVGPQQGNVTGAGTGNQGNSSKGNNNLKGKGKGKGSN